LAKTNFGIPSERNTPPAVNRMAVAACPGIDFQAGGSDDVWRVAFLTTLTGSIIGLKLES
jgi:hypothetical protein